MANESQKYDLHMLSFKRRGEGAYNAAYADGRNLQAWHLDIVETWLKGQRNRLAQAAKKDEFEELD